MNKIIEYLLGIQTAYAQLSAGSVAGETEGQLQGLVDFFIVKIPAFIAAFIVFILFFLLSKAIKGIVENKMASKFEEHKEMQILAGRTASTVTIIVGAIAALNIAGIDLTVIIAAAGFGIGFAIRDIIVNFLAGIMVLAQKQFTIGDFINVDGTVGKIKEIQGRSTIIQALDGTKVVVPNSDLFNKQVTSYTSNPFRRIEVPVGVEYGTDLEKAVKTCYDALQHTKGVLLEPKAVVLVKEFADSSINLVVRAWVESRGGWLQIKSDLAINIKKAFDAANINIPFPIRTIVYDKDTKAKMAAQAAEGAKQPQWLKPNQLVPEAVSAQDVNANVQAEVDKSGASFLTQPQVPAAQEQPVQPAQSVQPENKQ